MICLIPCPSAKGEGKVTCPVGKSAFLDDWTALLLSPVWKNFKPYWQ